MDINKTNDFLLVQMLHLNLDDGKLSLYWEVHIIIIFFSVRIMFNSTYISYVYNLLQFNSQ
jgi:hypothetical protein